MTYSDALAFIHSRRRGGPDLNRMRVVLDRLGAPDRRVPFVHVTGTNGKGSVSAFIASILRESGYRTGLFTSPFVRRFNERIKVDGTDIPDADLASCTEKVMAALGEYADMVAEFELVTLVGLTYFAQAGCDIAVLEVGMGGARDATNVIETSEVSVFTAIGLDHTRSLGNTVEEIASVKAGIVKENGAAAVYCDPGGVISQRCREMNARFVPVDFSRLSVAETSARGSVFDFDGCERLKISLGGGFQPSNAALAVTAVRMLRDRGWSVPDGAVRAGLENAVWPGRFELLRENPAFIIDGGHNPQAVEAAVKSLRGAFPGKKAVFIFGVMADKDVEGMVDVLAPAAERFYCVAPPAPRALDPARLVEMLKKRGLEAEAPDTVGEAVRRALRDTPSDGVICALGSLYILEEVRRAARD